MLGVLPFGEDPDLSGTAGTAVPQHLPPWISMLHIFFVPNVHHHHQISHEITYHHHQLQLAVAEYFIQLGVLYNLGNTRGGVKVMVTTIY